MKQSPSPQPAGPIGRRLRSFGFAFRGLGRMLRTETNARIHAAATLLVVAAGLFFDLGRVEWGLIALAIGAVWALEAVNTAFEALCDVASPEYHPQVQKAKDVAAAAVLIAAITAVCIGLAVFARPLLAWIAA